MRVAIVHDWLVGGGAERVVLELHKLYPDAPIYTSYCSNEWRKKLDGKVVTGFLQNWPFAKLRKFLPILRQYWFSHLDLSGFDLVISSSGAEAKGVRVPKNTLHVNYCHAPTHYYWDRYEQYLDHPGFGLLDPIARLGLRLLVAPMRHWDKRAAKRPDVMIANSVFTQKQIKKYYGRDSVVVHPPVDTERFKPLKSSKRSGFVVAGRQTPYKKIDLAVAACTKLGLSLTVIGNGPDHKKLIEMSGPTVTFASNVSDSEMPQRFRSAEAFIFPGQDDFGIVAVEALAAGTPVIAYKDGGALDYVKAGQTGAFFDKQSVTSLSRALQDFQPKSFSEKTIAKHAEVFSPTRFREAIREVVAKHYTPAL